MACLVTSSEASGGAALVAWIREHRTMRDMRPPSRQGTPHLRGLATDKMAMRLIITQPPVSDSAIGAGYWGGADGRPSPPFEADPMVTLRRGQGCATWGGQLITAMLPVV